jgi:hypothetical protein
VSTPAYTWADLCGDLPDHQTAVMDSYGGGQPSVAVQAETHGAYLIPGGVPAVDKGPDPGTVST